MQAFLLSRKTMLRIARFTSSYAHSIGAAIKRYGVLQEKIWDIPFTIRKIKMEEIPKIIELKKVQKTHDVLSAIYTWHRMDPEGIVVAVSENDDLIGVLASLRFHEDFHFGCLFYVANGYRKSGVGIDLYGECLKHAAHRNSGCNAAPGMFEFYNQFFTVPEDKWVLNNNETSATVNSDVLCNDVPDGLEIEPFQNSHISYMTAYDTELMGYHRKFLEWSCQENGSKTFVAFKRAAGTLECVGFGTIKESCIGAGRIGPLYADDPNVAEVLMKRLIMSMPNVRGFAMLSLSSNESANNLIKKIGCPVTKKIDRLYRHRKVEVDVKKIYAVFDINATAF